MMENFDELCLAEEKYIKNLLTKDESLILSTRITKINQENKNQERIFLLTNKNIYNLKVRNPLNGILSIIWSASILRRKIQISKITALTISSMGFEFVIHIEQEYDYRYSTLEKRSLILELLSNAYKACSFGKELVMCFKDSTNLSNYVTSKKDVKKGICKSPTSPNSTIVDSHSFDGRSNREWEDSIKEEENTKFQIKKKANLNDFQLIKVLGRGAYGKVMLVESKSNGNLFALKSLRKEEVILKDQLEHLKTERKILETVNHPFLINMHSSFQTEDKLFFLMPFLQGGELFQYLKKMKRFSEDQTRFYSSEILLGLEYLHSKDIIYRDLKPENILLDKNGHICLTDYGISKYIGRKEEIREDESKINGEGGRRKEEEKNKKKGRIEEGDKMKVEKKEEEEGKREEGEEGRTMVGTAEYLSPEVIQGIGHGKETDWWSFGILIYEMLFGEPPFYHRNQANMLEMIIEGALRFPSEKGLSAPAKDLIKKLLTKNPANRLGSKGAEEIKNHSFFKNVVWEGLLNKKFTPPIKPKIKGKYCVDNFDEEFTNEVPENSFIPTTNMMIIKDHQSNFENFSYCPPTSIASEIKN